MAHRQFTIFAAPGYRSEAENLAARIRMHNLRTIQLIRVVEILSVHAELKEENRCTGSPVRRLVRCQARLWRAAMLAGGADDAAGGNRQVLGREILRLEGKVTGRKPHLLEAVPAPRGA
jgi:hypothetical protein